jgi:hypothetical protein
MDPFLGNADNFCGAAGNGCSAAHAPGYLTTGNAVIQITSMSTYPVNFTGAFGDTVKVTNATGTVTFNFTSIFTNVLTTGALDLVLTGTFGGDTTGNYLAGQAANMSIACTQVQPGAAIGCVKTISSPPAGIPDAPSLSRRRWHCSAPRCSALARCAAAVSSNRTIPPQQDGAIWRCLLFCEGAKRARRLLAFGRNSRSAWDAAYR